MIKQLAPALRMMILFTVLTGFIYPGVVTGLCQALFRDKADGSLLVRNGQVLGSEILAQSFTRPEYFHPRPSAANYDATASTGSNLGPTSQKLIDRMKEAEAQFRKENPDFTGPIPADALTASGSGLDPDISSANAMAQAARVAAARHLSRQVVESLITANTDPRDLGFLGEPRVNVLKLNLALDRK
jgi:potassium-transporting ATPase KdpC subunit